jgi:hypothetical protein
MPLIKVKRSSSALLTARDPIGGQACATPRPSISHDVFLAATLATHGADGYSPADTYALHTLSCYTQAGCGCAQYHEASGESSCLAISDACAGSSVAP